MKKMFFLLLISGTVLSQPLTIEQSGNTIKTGSWEMGVEGGYGYDSWTVLGSASSLTKTDIMVSAFGRYASDNKTEVFFSVPYKFLSGTTDGVADSVTGLGVINLMVKNQYLSLGDKGGLGLGVFANITAGDVTKVLVENASDNNLGTGTGLGLLLANSFKAADFLVLDLDGSYEYKLLYTNAGGANIQEAPILALGIDGQLLLMSNLTVIAEAKWTTFGNYLISGKDSGTGTGNTFDTVYGARFDIDKLRLKAGVDLSMGDTTNRQFNYRVFSAVSYIFEK